MKIKETLRSLLKLEPMAASRGRNLARKSGVGLGAAALLIANAAWGQGQGWVNGCDYATPYTFITLAGNTNTIGWQDGTNQNALFNWPVGVTVGTNGVVYIVDNANNDVRAAKQVGTNWVVTTIAGTDGNQFGAADGTNGTIEFDGPEAIASDLAGNLYVADTFNFSVRKLTQIGTNWVSSTLAGGFKGPYGLAVAGATNIYVADTDNNVVDEMSLINSNWVVTTIAGTPNRGSGASDGTNGAAQFFEPAGLAVDAAGNIFVGDTGNYAVRKITPVGTNWVVTTIAGTLGNGTSGTLVNDGTNGVATFYSTLFYGPMGLAVDANDNVFVADSDTSLIRKISPSGTNWVTTTVAGLDTAPGNQDGTGTNALFGTPEAVALGSAGQLFVVDSGFFDLREGTAAVAPAAPPKLAFSRMTAAGSSFKIWWPGSGYTLQTNASLTTNHWGAYGGTINTINGTNSVTVTAPTGKLFYRLSE